jgi:hypothetical protein
MPSNAPPFRELHYLLRQELDSVVAERLPDEWSAILHRLHDLEQKDEDVDEEIVALQVGQSDN